MEEDRLQTDLGHAADIEAADAPPVHEPAPEPVQRQPKKRFIGRRTAAAGAAKNGTSVEDSGAITGTTTTTRIQQRTTPESKTVVMMYTMNTYADFYLLQSHSPEGRPGS